MSLRPLAISLVSMLLLSGGLALGAHATGQALGQGTEGLAAGLANIAAVGVEQPGAHTQARTHRAPPRNPARKQGSTPTPPPKRTDESRGKPTSVRTPSASGNTKPRGPGVAAVPSLATSLLRVRADAPACDDVYVYIVSTFDSPEDSVATLALNAERRGRQRRIGQRIGPYEVIAIGYNRRRVSSAVWLARGTVVCQALVQDPNPVRDKAQRAELARERARQSTERRKKLAKQRKHKKQRRRK